MFIKRETMKKKIKIKNNLINNKLEKNSILLFTHINLFRNWMATGFSGIFLFPNIQSLLPSMFNKPQHTQIVTFSIFRRHSILSEKIQL